MTRCVLMCVVTMHCWLAVTRGVSCVCMRAMLHGGDNDTLCVDVCSYDALLASGDSWRELCMYACHAAWW